MNEERSAPSAAFSALNVLFFFASMFLFMWTGALSVGDLASPLPPSFDLERAGIKSDPALSGLMSCADRWDGMSGGALCRLADPSRLASFSARAVRGEWNPFDILSRWEAAFEFLGIVPAGFDYAAHLAGLYSRGVAGFFYPHIGEIVIASSFPFRERVLFHEFEHFLQYRNSPLETARFDAFLRLDFDRYFALRAIEEGDAMEAERAALAMLDPSYVERARQAEREAPGGGESPLPPLLSELEAWPYSAGAEWAERVSDKSEWFRRCREIRTADVLAAELPPPGSAREPYTFYPPADGARAVCGPLLLALFLKGLGVTPEADVRAAAAMWKSDRLAERWWRIEFKTASDAERIGEAAARALGAGGDSRHGPFRGRSGWRLVSRRGRVLFITAPHRSPEALGDTMREMESEK